jgi:predicted dehydrogenase
MDRNTRREFLKTSTALGMAVASSTAAGQAYAASEEIGIGLIGCGRRSEAYVEHLTGVRSISDPDKHHLAQAAKAFGISEKGVVTDFRKILDDPSIDAVFVATPDHWHAPAAILACEAGKHVYVEKPCSHNVREGRLLLDAARRNNVVVQVGLQSRSCDFIGGAIQKLQEGIIGKVLSAKAWNIQQRKNIGHAKPSDPPAYVDYDLWVGPAPWVPFQENRFHYNWHWWRNFGTGGSGGDGPHEIDYARWGLGVTMHPSRIVALGDKFYFDDDRDFCDTQTAVFEYQGDDKVGDRRQLIYEQRLWSTNYPHNVDSGVEFYGTQGQMFLSKRGKLEILGGRNRKIDSQLVKPRPDPLGAHIQNFFDAIRTGQRPNADIEIGHLSATLGHLANLATRIGRSIQLDPETEKILGNQQAGVLLSRTYREGGHWAIPQGV